jgi:hypothetical protein
VIVIGLPNDHYHAFLDPVVVLLIAVPAGILLDRALSNWRSTRSIGAGLAGALVALGVGLVFTAAALRIPAGVDPDGGWPALRDAGARVVQAVDARPVYLVGLPEFKLPDAAGFPIVYAGGRTIPPSSLDMVPIPPDGPLVIVCDRLFEGAIGAACGGPAEDAYLTTTLVGGLWRGTPLLERFEASPRTWISIYAAP